MKRCTRTVTLALVMLGCVAIGFGQTVLQQNGELRDLQGRPVTAGDYAIEFSLWTESTGGEILWRESQEEVPVLDGRYSVELGRLRPLPLDPSGLWLETVVDGDLLSPRLQVSEKAVDCTLDRLTVTDIFIPDFDPAYETIFDIGKYQDRVNFGFQQSGFSANLFSLDIAARTFETITRFHVKAGGDASAFVPGSGMVIVGENQGTNIAIDDNEIMARDYNAPADLFLQQNGGDVYVNNALVHSSDRRLKDDVKDSEHGLADVLRLRPVSFAWPDRADERRLGLVAQEVQEVVEEVVYEDDRGMLGIAYPNLVPILIRAIQEQQGEIERLRADLETLRANAEGQPVHRRQVPRF